MTNIREYIMSLGSPQRGGKRPGVTNAHVLGAILVTSALLFAAFAMTSVSFSDTEQNEDMCLSNGLTGETFAYNGLLFEITYQYLDQINGGQVSVIGFESASIAALTIPSGAYDAGGILGENHYAVTSIGSQAFFQDLTLTSVVIPNSVKTIGNAAFGGCTEITTVTIGNSVTTIGEGAFYECSKLTGIVIPDSVVSIETEAFAKSGLASVTIGNSIRNIGDRAFYLCNSLLALAIPFGPGITGGRDLTPSKTKIILYSMEETGSVTATRPNENYYGTITLAITPAATDIAVGYVSLGARDVTPTGSGGNWAFDYTPTHPSYFVAVDLTSYALTVNGGTGSGSYAAGAHVNINATVPAGKQFSGWTADGGVFGNVNSASTTFTMPASAVTVTANFVDIPPATYIVSMTGGSATPGSGVTGSTVTLTPGTAPSGHQFKQWNVTAAGGGSLSGNTFTIGTGNAAIEAVWEIIPEPSSSSSGDNGGDDGISPAVIAVVSIAAIGGVGAAIWFFFFKP